MFGWIFRLFSFMQLEFGVSVCSFFCFKLDTYVSLTVIHITKLQAFPHFSYCLSEQKTQIRTIISCTYFICVFCFRCFVVWHTNARALTSLALDECVRLRTNAKRQFFLESNITIDDCWQSKSINFQQAMCVANLQLQFIASDC